MHISSQVGVPVAQGALAGNDEGSAVVPSIIKQRQQVVLYLCVNRGHAKVINHHELLRVDAIAILDTVQVPLLSLLV